eukprot:TRINITY_DN773163_c0_g1_i1.p1 TRINITY_DN773163_c0_g1~~TRINITY_DN773163_c0_g1_i1.p1  ORF type:complete len:446 (-),score=118.31 TRINITY_DN773163_c0_g1_i1:475-1812(-)
MMKLLLFLVIAVATVQCLNIAEYLSRRPEFSQFYGLLKDSDQIKMLNRDHAHFTVFAPQNNAFKSLENYEKKYIWDQQERLTKFAKYHMSYGRLTESILRQEPSVITLEGAEIFTNIIGGNLTLSSTTCQNNVQIIAPMILDNGIIHIIDSIMIPDDLFYPNSILYAEQRGEGRVIFGGYGCRSKKMKVVAKNQEKVVGLAVDSKEGTMFWSNDESVSPYDSWITSRTFDGSQQVILTRLYDPQGLAVDTNTKKLYFAEHLAGDVHTSDYYGNHIDTVLQLGDNKLIPDITLDEDLKKIFVSIQTRDTSIQGSVMMMDYDTTNQKILEDNMVRNYGVCLDSRKKLLYVTQGGHGGGLKCFSYGDTPCAQPSDMPKGYITLGLEYPYSCDVDNSMAEYGGPTIIAISLTNIPGSIIAINDDGSNTETIVSGITAPMGITFAVRPEE